MEWNGYVISHSVVINIICYPIFKIITKFKNNL